MKSILVTGSARWYERLPQRSARMVGTTLAHAGFRLITGNATGVDRWVAEAFCPEIERRGESASKYYTQLYLPYWGRGSLWPLPGFQAPDDSKVVLKRKIDWDAAAISCSDAAIMIGGRWGALRIARRFIEAGKTVFPVPFTGGRSNEVFQDILRTWNESPVPGLSRSQFLTLASPWIGGTGPLANLLLGTLAEEAEIFISYRRADSQTAVARLYRDLAEHFGARRVFIDLRDIAPSAQWQAEIERASQTCRVGIVVIGPRWTDGRLNEPDDVLRGEVAGLLRRKKVVMPILVEGAALPDRQSLPNELRALPDIQARSLDNSSWDLIVAELIRILERHLAAGRGVMPKVVDSPAAGPKSGRFDHKKN